MFKGSKASKLLRQLQLTSRSAEPDEQPAEATAPPPKQDYLNERDCHRTYSCIHCRAHLANHDELISKLFQGNHGRAYLFNKVLNVGCKQAVERELLTGLHAVADIYCDCCETTLGWKYEQAFVPSQKYKEGKYIIELVHMLKENQWDLNSYNSERLLEEASSEEPTPTPPPITRVELERSVRQPTRSRQLSAPNKPAMGITSTSSRIGQLQQQQQQSQSLSSNNLTLNSSGSSSSSSSSSRDESAGSYENLTLRPPDGLQFVPTTGRPIEMEPRQPGLD